MRNYLRHPHLSHDLVTFVAADDVWIAPVHGGRAWRLTHDSVPVTSPRFSPDGEHVAFVSHRDGHAEAYVVPVQGGGGPRRLTWWGVSRTTVLGWDGPDRVLVASYGGHANIRHLVVRSVGLDGSLRTPRWGPASGVAVRADGVVALATVQTRPPAHWKRYRGGTAARLWVGRPQGAGDGEDLAWERLLREDTASLVDPMWVDGRLVLVSDRAALLPGTVEEADRQADLWAFAQGELNAASVPEQVTHQGPDLGYVRDATTDGHRVVWHSRGRLWLLDGLGAEPRPVEVTLPGAAPTPYSLSPTDRLGPLRPDHGGDASLAEWHGAAYWLAHREGPARALVADDGVRAREPRFLGRTGRAVLVTDADGDDRLEVHDLGSGAPPQVVASGGLGRVLHLQSDPAGGRVATVSHDGVLRLVDLTGTEPVVGEVARSRQGEARSPAFSPDGRYLVWSQPALEGEPADQVARGIELHQLMLLDTHDVAGGPVALTSGTFHDHDPAFTPDGKHVVFLSERTFDPDYDAHEFALSFGSSTRPWLLPLAADEPPPFGPSATGWRISGTDEKDRDARHHGGHGRPGAHGQDQQDGGVAHDGSEEHDDDPPPPSPDVDVHRAEQRVVPFPVPSGRYRDLRVTHEGVAWVVAAGGTGELGSRRAGVTGEPPTDAVQHWSFERRCLDTVVEAVDTFEVSGDGRWLVVRHKDAVTVTPADRKPEEDDDPAVVKVDLSRLRREVDPRRLWRQMYEENGRLMRDHYWREDMDGVDWDGVLDRYRPLVDAVASHDDLLDVLWETVGELNTSHAYVLPAEPPGSEAAERRLGLLGADLARTTEGWALGRILPGESSEPDARSPLEAAGVGAREGDLVVAVDGAPVDGDHGPHTRLLGAAGKPVELTLRRDGRDRRVVVVPLADEEVLRYQDWVRSRRAYVRERSAGRLGYVHVPDMMSYGWAQLHRDLRHASACEGLVADVRYNRGGHTSELVLARLVSRTVGWDLARHYAAPERYPASAPRGPVVLVANEHSGSDGDIVNAAGRALGLGPVVGVRTWGGVVGIDGRFDLVDGTEVTQPRYSFWLDGQGWGVENHGVDPDIEVEHTPGDFFGAADPQLDRAVAEALRQLEERPAAVAPEPPPPRVRR